MLAIQRIDQRLLIDQTAAGAVDDAHAGLHLGDGSGIDDVLRVLSVSGVCSVMKSARLRRSSSSTLSTPMSLARSGRQERIEGDDLHAQAERAVAAMAPILPQPITPSVLPVISTPMKRFFSHLPACVDASACGISRASENISAIACSAVVIELPNGVFITMMPLAVAAGISTLSTPMPARPMTFRLRRGEDLFGRLGGRADGEAVIVADDLGELVLVLAEVRLEVDVDAAIPKDLHGGFGRESVGNENFGGAMDGLQIPLGAGVGAKTPQAVLTGKRG
jgi:hypothetical protein